MQELVGECKECKKPVYCKDGFIDGIVLDDQTLVCFDCSDKEDDKDIP
ncbi:hypothetical protein [Paenibacillus mendelii]|uniref:Inhibitor of sigma-G Gin n=1 Tax=Paenibacillus mendelii TaxID=206163 RepID=A0ABV6J653_9BACL|nr:hypothetical protein [Paenibacillus mendelii]MCQ6559402.1 hypothetical protein [Paenibacillus mendelii]